MKLNILKIIRIAREKEINNNQRNKDKDVRNKDKHVWH